GYMFGKGVYFADMVTKSANYCHASRDNDVGVLLLCEVALGDMCPKLAADYDAARLPPGKRSVKGVGRTHPDPSQDVIDANGVRIPLGPGVAQKLPGDPPLSL